MLRVIAAALVLALSAPLYAADNKAVAKESYEAGRRHYDLGEYTEAQTSKGIVSLPVAGGSFTTHLYVSDPGCDAVRRVTLADATVVTVAGTPGRAQIIPGPLPATLSLPTSLAFSPLGELIVQLQENNALMQIRF